MIFLIKFWLQIARLLYQFRKINGSELNLPVLRFGIYLLKLWCITYRLIQTNGTMNKLTKLLGVQARAAFVVRSQPKNNLLEGDGEM